MSTESAKSHERARSVSVKGFNVRPSFFSSPDLCRWFSLTVGLSFVLVKMPPPSKKKKMTAAATIASHKRKSHADGKAC